MPKLKTSKSIKKRFKISKTGKIIKRRPFKSHILSKKSKKRKRFLRRASVLGSAQETRMIKKLLPYG